MNITQIVAQFFYIGFYMYIAWRASKSGEGCKGSILGTVGIFALFIILPIVYIILMISLFAANVDIKSSNTQAVRDPDTVQVKVPSVVKDSLVKMLNRFE